MHALLAKWAPPEDRSKLGAFIYAGQLNNSSCSFLVKRKAIIINLKISTWLLCPHLLPKYLIDY